MTGVQVIHGDLLDQEVDAIVNPWNRNIIPWFLLIPHGVSGAIRKRAGTKPFRELGRAGPMRSGGAVLTSAGRLPHRAIVHVAGLTAWWTTNLDIVRACARSACSLAIEHGMRSVAFPLVGAGVGGLKPAQVQDALHAEIEPFAEQLPARIVIFTPNA